MSQAASTQTRPPAYQRRVPFVSLRWRFAFPLVLVVLVVGMLGAYVLVNNLTSGFDVSEANVLLHHAQTVNERTTVLHQRDLAEARRIAFTSGVSAAIVNRDSAQLVNTLQGLAAAANLDSALLLDANGAELAGVLRDEAGAFSVNNTAILADTALVQDILRDGRGTGLLRTPEGLLLYSGVPVQRDGQVVGVALVGRRLDAFLAAVRASTLSHLALYGPGAALLQTSFDLETVPIQDIGMESTTFDQVITQNVAVETERVIAGTAQRVLYTPLRYGGATLGVLGVMMPDSVPFVTLLGRQLAAMFAAALVATVLVTAFAGLEAVIQRANRVRRTAEALARGERAVRTGMAASDELAAAGAALDAYADRVQVREDGFRVALQRQRRERNYLLAVLQSMPDGVLVQDRTGRVILLNPVARELLGSQDAFQNADLRELVARVPDVLGRELAPGVYALGDPRRIAHNGKMLSAQAAAVQSSADQRIGTVLILRDITEQVRQEQAREQMLRQLSEQVQEPLVTLAQQGAMAQQPAREFARDISRHAAALQKLIVDMRELTQYSRSAMQRVQRALPVENLLWAVANDWRQIANAAEIEMLVRVSVYGLLVLGDENRLRWALGNVVDNAIKFTLPGGSIMLEVNQAYNGMALLRVRDNGVGIADADLPHIFTPFYRGTPVTPDGQVIHVPGMGQGLRQTRQIVQAHGGRMRIKSKVGVGTAVYFALPLTAGVGYELPLLDEDAMEGETVVLPEDFERLWRN